MPDALADNPDTALELLEALVSHMGDVFELIRAEQRVSVAVPDAEIAADIWDLGAGVSGGNFWVGRRALSTGSQ